MGVKRSKIVKVRIVGGGLAVGLPVELIKDLGLSSEWYVKFTWDNKSATLFPVDR